MNKQAQHHGAQIKYYQGAQDQNEPTELIKLLIELRLLINCQVCDLPHLLSFNLWPVKRGAPPAGAVRT